MPCIKARCPACYTPKAFPFINNGFFVRNLLLFLFVLFGIWWVRRVLGGRGARTRGRGARGDTPADGPERMPGCAHCGVHAPESEGVYAGEQFFCCEAHRRLGGRDRGE